MVHFIVAQLGARMNYAVPCVLHKAGVLARLYTDICAAKGWPRVLSALPQVLQPSPLKRLAGRVPRGVPHGSITAFVAFGLEYARRRRAAKDPSETTAADLCAGRTYCRLILDRDVGGATGVYAFNSAGLELLRAARERGTPCMVEQTIAPREVEDALLREEHKRFPGWEAFALTDTFAPDFAARERAEWQAADFILCGSEFVKDSIIATGGPGEKCAVVPYGVDFSTPRASKGPRHGQLRALFVGAVGLRKGMPYLLQAARMLGPKIKFRAVGSINLSPAAATALGRHVELAGPVPRLEIRHHFYWADVFVLPSICEGSATVCYEALAAGLPVITTANAGSVVRNGIEGFITPVRAPEAIAEKLELFAVDTQKLAEMSRNAVERSKDFTVEKYGQRLLATLARRDLRPLG